ncbi:hypothetical protein AAFF_G00294600 [Aldrovandia affinis]|uniref:Uncharacterized protein n=1 Tax=Aldrovandia affinis TaxID=143900 RepID=A0AAD7R8X4_9TELE|nr:hypothetical protein AAFF_G00294600 [Aldrovandia affinis]
MLAGSPISSRNTPINDGAERVDSLGLFACARFKKMFSALSSIFTSDERELGREGHMKSLRPAAQLGRDPQSQGNSVKDIGSVPNGLVFSAAGMWMGSTSRTPEEP